MDYEIQTGSDTFSYYHGLSRKQRKAILKRLKALPNFITVKDDYENNSCEYVSNYFAAQGVKLRISHFGETPWALFVIVHPTLVLGNEDRSALYQVKIQRYAQMRERQKSGKACSRFLRSLLRRSLFLLTGVIS